MEYLSEVLQALIADKEMVRWLFVIFVVLAIAVLALGVSFIVMSFMDPVRKRVKHISTDSNSLNEPVLLADSEEPEPVAKFLLPSSELERDEAKERLMHAGFISSGALGTFYGIRILLLVIMPALVLLVAPVFPELTPKQVLMSAGVAALVGLILPGMVLDRLILNRKRKLRNGFPDALDLLIVCVEAGMGLNSALQRVADELDVSHPELATEIALVTVEIRAGIDRVDALKNLAKRTGLEDINGMVSLLAQSMRFGTSVAETLRVYSEDFRDRRMQAAEEEAAKVGTKMIFPMVFCLFPAFFVVAIGPAILSVLEVFK